MKPPWQRCSFIFVPVLRAIFPQLCEICVNLPFLLILLLCRRGHPVAHSFFSVRRLVRRRIQSQSKGRAFPGRNQRESSPPRTYRFPRLPSHARHRSAITASTTATATRMTWWKPLRTMQALRYFEARVSTSHGYADMRLRNHLELSVFSCAAARAGGRSALLRKHRHQQHTRVCYIKKPQLCVYRQSATFTQQTLQYARDCRGRKVGCVKRRATPAVRPEASISNWMSASGGHQLRDHVLPDPKCDGMNAVEIYVGVWAMYILQDQKQVSMALKIKKVRGIERWGGEGGGVL
jgi:hypothetical protein